MVSGAGHAHLKGPFPNPASCACLQVPLPHQSEEGANPVVNNGIHHVLISPLVGHFEDKSLAFAFNSQNELASASGNMIVWFPESAQLTCPTHACGK
ncbi:hypothetical protein DSO57_1007214 [Entomophthora muscae]|uniref:Uncharacterized protein n=1 Tax=Entomophthora muscae TaxID=34485 RepID=A0ACC2TI27_9FUNG|nr:hypothetical protein DSO57_1007214 [Entomophthora muscae]